MADKEKVKNPPKDKMAKPPKTSDKEKVVKAQPKDKAAKPEPKDKAAKPQAKDKVAKPQSKDKVAKPQHKDKAAKIQPKGKAIKTQVKDKIAKKPKDNTKDAKSQQKIRKNKSYFIRAIAEKKMKAAKKAKTAKRLQKAKAEMKDKAEKKDKPEKTRKQQVDRVTKGGKVIKARKLKAGTFRFGVLKRTIIKRLVKPRVKKTGLKEKTPLYITKPIGGEKNGGKRTILVKKPPAYYPAELKKKKEKPKKRMVRSHLKKSLTPGTICIVVAGPHKGKKVVFLKQLQSGLCLITGPFMLNKCPLRRINQIYLIATETKLALDSKFKVPRSINDKFFKRVKLNNKKAKKEGEDIFNKKPQKYIPSANRAVKQKLVDKVIVQAIRKHKERESLVSYMRSKFALRNKQYPHLMKF